MISVVIPMFNAGKYIKKCLESIFNNTYQNFEIIIIDDGSTDDSAKIIKSFNGKKIRIYKQSRKGPGNARNYGIQKSIGDYIYFIDSDDTINKFTFELLMQDIQKYDIVIGNYKIFYDQGGVEEFITPRDTRFNMFFESVTVWNRLYRKSFIEKNNIKFEEIFQGEDRLFLADLYSYSPRVKVIDEFIYNWARHDGELNKTLTHIEDHTNFDGQVNCMIKFKNKLYDKLDGNEQLLLLEHLRYCCIYLLSILVECKDNTCDMKQFNKFVNSLKFNENRELYKEIFKKDWSDSNEEV